MTRTYELLRKLRINDRRSVGEAITTATDLFGDRLSVIARWDENKLQVCKAVEAGEQRSPQWSVLFNTSGQRLRLETHMGIPPQETGCIAILNWISKDLIQFPPFSIIEGQTHESTRSHRAV